MNYTKMTASSVPILFGVLVLVVGMFVSMTPFLANAATYAYVTSTGEVQSVTADNWMTAIDIAPNRHVHSGVLLLMTASDFTIVGDNVSAF